MQKNTVLASVQENITIKQDGNYVLDLILFPDIEEGVEEIDIDLNEEVIPGRNYGKALLVGLVVLFVSGIFGGIVYYLKTKKHESINFKPDNKNHQAGGRKSYAKRHTKTNPSIRGKDKPYDSRA